MSQGFGVDREPLYMYRRVIREVGFQQQGLFKAQHLLQRALIEGAFDVVLEKIDINAKQGSCIRLWSIGGELEMVEVLNAPFFKKNLVHLHIGINRKHETSIWYGNGRPGDKAFLMASIKDTCLMDHSTPEKINAVMRGVDTLDGPLSSILKELIAVQKVRVGYKTDGMRVERKAIDFPRISLSDPISSSWMFDADLTKDPWIAGSMSKGLH